MINTDYIEHLHKQIISHADLIIGARQASTSRTSDYLVEVMAEHASEIAFHSAKRIQRMLNPEN